MQESSFIHATLAKYAAQLYESINVIGRVEEGEAATEKSKEDNATTPDVDYTSLRCAFEQDFRGAETSGACTVCSARVSRVFFRICGRWW